MLEIYPYKEEETLIWLKEKLDYLATHNKNYTKTQYFAITDIQTTLSCLKRVNREEMTKKYTYLLGQYSLIRKLLAEFDYDKNSKENTKEFVKELLAMTPNIKEEDE